MEHPMLALYPGARVSAAKVDAHVVGDGGRDQVLAVHVTRYPIDPPDRSYQLPDTLQWLHLAAVVPEPWETIKERIPAYYSEDAREHLRRQHARQESLLRQAEVVITRAEDQPPLLVLDAAMITYRGASAVGVVVDSRTCLVGLRTRPDGYKQDALGYAVVMTAAGPQPGPVALYASALLGWMNWWWDRASELSDEHVPIERLPPPPLDLDVVEAWTPYRVRLESPERVRWAARPTRQPGQLYADGSNYPDLL